MVTAKIYNGDTLVSEVKEDMVICIAASNKGSTLRVSEVVMGKGSVGNLIQLIGESAKRMLEDNCASDGECREAIKNLIYILLEENKDNEEPDFQKNLKGLFEK